MNARVIAFYGFKGGSGRSLLLAHMASMLAIAGKSVLMIDADLEAPGLGDFFDSPGKTTFDQWRGTDGFMDLMRQLAVHVGDKETAIAQRIRDLATDKRRGMLRRDQDGSRTSIVRLRLEGRQGNVDADRAKELDLWLLGPGNHRAEVGLDAHRYVGNFLDFDWGAFIRRGGDKVLSELGKFLRSGEHGFDHILLDARTGYNLPSLLLIQHLATHVVGVSTWSSQSIDGMARMLAVTRQPQWQTDPVPTLLVMNKGTDSRSANPTPKTPAELAQHAKDLLVEYYFGTYGTNFLQVDLPFADRLQSNDHMVWSDLDWNAYLKARKRVEDGVVERSGYGLVDLSEGSDDAAYRLCQRLAEIHQFLFDEAVDEDEVLKPLFERFGKERREAASNFNRQSEEAAVRTAVLEDAEAAVGRMLTWLESPTGRDADDQFKKLEANFRALGKEQRALWRHLMLQAVRPHLAEGQGPAAMNDDSKMDRLSEIRQRFALDLDPTEAVRAVVSDSGQRRTVRNAAMSLIRCLRQEEDGEEAKKHLASLREEIGSAPTNDQSRFLALAEALAAFSSKDPAEPLPLAMRIANLFGSLLPVDAFPSPRSSTDFGQWNLYDLLEHFTTRLGAVFWHPAFLEPPQRQALVAALAPLSETLLQKLQDPAPWRVDSLSPDERDQYINQRSQWLVYVDTAIRIRRLVRAWAAWPDGDLPVDAVGLLNETEIAALRRAAGLPRPSAAAQWQWTKSPVSGLASPQDRFALETRRLTLTLERARSHDIAPQAAMLLDRILDNPMARMTPADTGSSAAQAEERQAWADLLTGLAALAQNSQSEELVHRISRRAVRLAAGGWAAPVRYVSSFSLWCAGTGIGFDAALQQQDLWHPEASGLEALSGDEGKMQGRLPRWWKIIQLGKAGRYREALQLFGGPLDGPNEADWSKLGSGRDIADYLSYLPWLYANQGSETDAREAFPLYMAAFNASQPGLATDRRGVCVNYLALVRMHIALERDTAGPVLDRLDSVLPDEPTRSFEPLRAEATLLRGLVAPGRVAIADLPALVETALSGITRYFAGGADRSAAQWAGLPWTGMGLFGGDGRVPGADLRIAEILAPAVEIALAAGAQEQARAFWDRWHDFAWRENIRDLPPEDLDPEQHASRAFLHAFEASLAEDPQIRETAIAAARASRDRDIEANGVERTFAYRRIFTLCGIPD